MQQRKIAFRAWSKTYGMRQVMGWLGTTLYVENGGSGHDAMNMENWELMEATGLLDKNGKEIYEGDVVRWEKSGKDWVVFWSDSGAGFLMQATDDMEPVKLHERLIERRSKLFEIIGNVYENPELLTPKEV